MLNPREIMNIQQMMKQAQQMQDRMQKQMAELRVEATSGGGMVTIVMNGAKQVQSLKIDPEAVSKEDVEMLQDLIVAALNDAHRKADEEMSKQMSGMMGGLKIPGLPRRFCRIGVSIWARATAGLPSSGGRWLRRAILPCLCGTVDSSDSGGRWL